MKKIILAIDQGTTGTTVLGFDKSGQIVCRAYSEFTQHYPRPGWVEHDAQEIWEVTAQIIQTALQQAGIKDREVEAIGITNQRETTVIWKKSTGKPIHPAIVWQCRRTSEMCEKLKAAGLAETFQNKTGLVLDAYFSGTKIKWLLDNVPHARAQAEKGELLFGTIDTWLLWKLTGGKVHATDYTNAARTLIFNIHQKQWDEELLKILNIPPTILPTVQTSSGLFGYTLKNGLFEKAIPITGIAGDQQAALFGQGCWEPGMVKNTYGTGCFMIMNTGAKPIRSENGLLSTLACNQEGKPCFALEGSVFISGAVVQWLRDELQLIQSAAETEQIAASVEDTNGVYIVPAFTGLGAPHWEMNARGVITGLTRGANRAHIVRAALESMAFQSHDVMEVMALDAKIPIKLLRVDGGAAANNFLMQFQADILNLPVDRPQIIETTALGAAFLAGLATGFWQTEELQQVRIQEKLFEPHIPASTRQNLIQGWRQAVRMLLK